MGARRCTNPDYEFGNRWIVRKMVRIKNGKLLCTGRGCDTVYEPRQVIDPESEDYGIYVGYVQSRSGGGKQP